MPRWTQNGYIDSQGKRVLNEDIWKQIEKRIALIEAGGLSVQLWQVPKEKNTEADALAKMGVGVSDR